MKKIKVENRLLTVNSGQVQLTAEQARVRGHALKAVEVKKDGSGVYDVTAPLHFKQGETLGFSGDVGKNGDAFDPEAEEIARMDAAEKAEKERRAAVEKAIEQARQDLETHFAGRVEKAAAKVRADLEAEFADRVEKAAAEKLAAAMPGLTEKIKADLVAKGSREPASETKDPL